MRKTETIHIANINGKDMILRETDTLFKTPFTELQGANYTTTRFTFPKRAHVHLAEGEENKFGEKAKRIVIWPPGTFEVHSFDKSPVTTQVTNLLGQKYTIDENGSFSTALLDALQFAEEIGYTVDPKVLEEMSIDDSTLMCVFGDQI